jgi:hypothetical protein
LHVLVRRPLSATLRRVDLFQSVTITAVSFFASTDGGFGDTWNGVSTWQMSLSTTSTSLGGMSATFDDNVGGDVIVFDTATFLGSVC